MKTILLTAISFAAVGVCLMQNVVGAELAFGASTSGSGGGNTNRLYRVIQVPTTLAAPTPATNTSGISRDLVQAAASPTVSKTATEQQIMVLDSISVTSPILNVDFTDENGAKVGPAAIGQSSSDFWNRSNTKWNSGTVTFYNLYWSDGSASTIDLTVQNAPGL